MKANQQILANAQINRNTSTHIVRSMERISRSVAADLDETNPTYNISETNIGMAVSLVTPSQRHVSVVSYSANGASKIGIFNGYNNSIGNNIAINGLISLPTDMMFTGGKKSVAVTSITYADGVFFLTGKQLKKISIGKGKSRKEVGSSVVSASVGDKDFSDLQTPVTISFRNVSQSLGTGNVKFWNFQSGKIFSIYARKVVFL